MNITTTLFRAENQLERSAYLRTLIAVAFCTVLLAACGEETTEPTPNTAPTAVSESTVMATIEADTIAEDLSADLSEGVEEPEEAAESSSVEAEDSNRDDSNVVDSADMRSPQDLWVSMACSACHRLDEAQSADNIGQPGPHMGNLHETAGSRIDGLSSMEYVVASIVAPNDFVNEGYIANVMPQNFAETMSEVEVTNLAEWILDPNRED